MPNYEKSKDIFIQRKVSDGSFEEYPLVVKPNSVIITNENNDLMLMDTSSFIAGTGSITLSISSSFSTTSSYSYNTPSSKTASYVRGVNVDGIVSYSSQSISSSFASSSISSSYSLSSLSSSFSPINPTYSASVSNIINTKQPTLTNQLYVITSSLALSASYYPSQIIQTTVASASWVSSSVKIVSADTASYILPSNIANNYSSSVSTQLGTKQNTLTNTLYVLTSSLAVTASYTPNLYPQIIQTTVVSASWVSSSVKIINSDTASVANSILFNNLKTTDTPTFASINAGASVTATTFIGNLNGNVVGNLTGNSTGSIFGSASYAKSSNSASYATNAGNAISAQDSSTAEKAALADTASYILPSNIANNYSSSISTQIGLKQNLLTNSLYVLTASLALTASYASNSGGTSLGTGSTYPITSSWAVNSLSASYVSFSQSYQVNTLSASWASSSISASYVPNLYPQTIQSSASWASHSFNSEYTTQSIYSISASWVSSSVKITTADTASYFNQKWLNTGSLYPITTSWASQSLSSLYSITASYFNQKWLNTGSTYPITASWSLTSSIAISASYAPSISSDISISSSWASQSLSASFAQLPSLIMVPEVSASIFYGELIYGPLIGHASTATTAINSLYSDTSSYLNGNMIVGNITSSVTPIFASKTLSGYFLPIYISGSIQYLPLYI